MYSAYKLNKQDDNIQPWRTPFPILNQSIVPCPILTVAACPTYRFLRRRFFVIHTGKAFNIVNEAEADFFFFLFPSFFCDSAYVGSLISDSSTFSKSIPMNIGMHFFFELQFCLGRCPHLLTAWIACFPITQLAHWISVLVVWLNLLTGVSSFHLTFFDFAWFSCIYFCHNILKLCSVSFTVFLLHEIFWVSLNNASQPVMLVWSISGSY